MYIYKLILYESSYFFQSKFPGDDDYKNYIVLNVVTIMINLSLSLNRLFSYKYENFIDSDTIDKVF